MSDNHPNFDFIKISIASDGNAIINRINFSRKSETLEKSSENEDGDMIIDRKCSDRSETLNLNPSEIRSSVGR
jgi:hypothetical protein